MRLSGKTVTLWEREVAVEFLVLLLVLAIGAGIVLATGGSYGR
jgi:hypothetical protein